MAWTQRVITTTGAVNGLLIASENPLRRCLAVNTTAAGSLNIVNNVTGTNIGMAADTSGLGTKWVIDYAKFGQGCTSQWFINTNAIATITVFEWTLDSKLFDIESANKELLQILHIVRVKRRKNERHTIARTYGARQCHDYWRTIVRPKSDADSACNLFRRY